jgi:hypothetical protein
MGLTMRERVAAALHRMDERGRAWGLELAEDQAPYLRRADAVLRLVQARKPPGQVHLALTPAQARCVNSALVALETEVESDQSLREVHGLAPGVLERTQARVQAALDDAGLSP